MLQPLQHYPQSHQLDNPLDQKAFLNKLVRPWSKETSLAWTNLSATNKLSLLSIAGGISPIDVVRLVAREQEAIITIAILVV